MKLSAHRKMLLKKAEHLTSKQKEVLSILSIEYMRHFDIYDRPRPSTLLKKVLKMELTKDISSELIATKQAKLLNIEIDNYLKKNGKSCKNIEV